MLRELRRGFRFVVIGIGTFIIDLALLVALIDIGNMDVLLATAVTFLIALSINYYLTRKLVFQRSDRGETTGYTYFLLIAMVGLFSTVGFMWAFITYTDLSVVASRILVALLVGIWKYVANLRFNFQVVGQKLD